MTDDRRQPASLRFAGYGSVFHRVDAGRDVVMPGAFARAIRAGGAQSLPLLWQHDPSEPVGRVVSLIEDARGLRVVGEISLGARRGRDAAALVQGGIISGLSIGYRVRRATVDRKTRVRKLHDVELLEISLVTFPMQPQARVLGVEQAE